MAIFKIGNGLILEKKCVVKQIFRFDIQTSVRDTKMR